MSDLQQSIAHRLDLLYSGKAVLDLRKSRIHKKTEAQSFSFTTLMDFVIFVENGCLGIELKERSVRLYPGQCLWLPPNTPYRLHTADGDPVTQHINLQFGFLDHNGAFIPSPPDVITAEDAWELQPTLHHIHELFHYGHPLEEQRLKALMGTLLTGLGVLVEEVKAYQFTTRQKIQIREAILENLNRSLSASDLAKTIGLSPDYFTRKFKATFGIAPRFYIKEQRMHQAALLLTETTDPLKTIADEVGMDNLGLFCRQFRDVHGCTPTAYRRRG